MQRVELKISSGSLVKERPKESLAFRYLHVSGSLDELVVRKREEIGFRVLGRIATNLRLRRYGASEASAQTRKRLGLTRMKCGREPNVFFLGVWPPDGDDEWLMEPIRIVHQGRKGKLLPVSELADWPDIHAILEESIAGIKGASNLQWVSRIEHEMARAKSGSEPRWISRDEGN